MNANVCQIISIIGFSLAAIFAIAAILLFFVFHIPALLDELSGKTAARQIAEMREKNRKSASKGQIMERFNFAEESKGKEAKKFYEEQEETELLENETTSLYKNETIPLYENETILLGENETTLLSREEAERTEDNFEIIQSWEEIHTNIVI